MAIQLGSAYGKISIDSSGVKKGVSESKRELESFGDVGFKALRGLATGATLVTGAALTMKKIFDFGEAGAQLDYTRDKFDRLSESIGTTGDALMKDLKAATKGLVSDAELVASAGDLMALGLVKTHDEAVRLTRVAGALGMNMNQLVLTLTNQTTMRFDALGVSVAGFDEKVKRLKATGLDANEAFTEAFLQQAEEQLARVGDVADSDVGAFKRLTAATDNLSDAAKKRLAPFLADAAEAAYTLLTAAEQINAAFEDTKGKIEGSATSYDEYIDLVTQIAVNAKKMTDEQRQAVISWAAGKRSVDDLNQSGSAYQRILARLIVELGLMSAEQWEAERAQADFVAKVAASSSPLDDYATRLRAIGDAAGEYDKALELVEKAQEAAAEAQEILNQKLSDLKDMVRGELGTEMDNFAESQEELRDKAEELSQEILKLQGQKYLTKAQKDQLDGLWGDLHEVEGQIKSNAEAHDEATKRILFDILTQRAAIDGLTQAEYNALLGVAEHYGLIDEATATAMRAADSFFSNLEEDAEVSLQDIQQLDMAMRGLPTMHNFTVNINTVQRGVIYTEEGEPVAPVPGTDLEPGLVPGGARGLHGYVPPGFPDDSYLVAASSGERVDISPAGKGGGGDQYVVQHFYNAGAAALGLAYVETARARRLDASMGR